MKHKTCHFNPFSSVHSVALRTLLIFCKPLSISRTFYPAKRTLCTHQTVTLHLSHSLVPWSPLLYFRSHLPFPVTSCKGDRVAFGLVFLHRVFRAPPRGGVDQNATVLWLSDISLCGWTTFCFSIQLLTDAWVVSTIRLLGMTLQ